MTPSKPVERFAVLPDPGEARSLDHLVERLRSLKTWAGNPSYEAITDRINSAWEAAGRPASELARRGTVVDCFKTGRRRLNTDLVIAVVQALHPDAGYVAQWRQQLRIVAGETQAATQVRAQDWLPDDLADFTGRTTELDRLRQLLRHSATASGGTVVISAIEGMAGVGKTQLAIRAGHLLAIEQAFEQVLFVNLRGFHPDLTQPPADPAAVLDNFLRLLGVPGQQIPHDLAARVALYSQQLAGKRALVVLDNAANEEQVQPLICGGPGCLTLVTSRRRLTGLHPAMHLSVDVFTADEALDFLRRAAPDVPAGDNPDALVRIAERCGYLPLALGLVAGQMRAKPGWTLTDHADRLDERHRDHHLESVVELALDRSYLHLPPDRRRLFRLVALHPGHDVDGYAAAAVTDANLDTTREHLDHLCADHLLQQTTPGRYVFHDLVRAYATTRAHDEDRPPERRAAMTRLFDYYLAAAAAALNALHPAEAHLRPHIPLPTTPIPDLTDPDTALAWLNNERPTLIAVAAHTATHGWPTHTTRLARTLFRYLGAGHFTDALAVHEYAHHAACRAGDPAGQAHALTDLGGAYVRLGRFGPAAEHYERALDLFRHTGDVAGQARTMNSLGVVEQRSGRYPTATDYYAQAMTLYRQAGDPTGEASSLANLGTIEDRLGHYQPAADHYEQALTLFQQAGNRDGEARTLNNLGYVEVLSGRYGPASDHLQQALTLNRQLGNRIGEVSTLDSLGSLHIRLGQPAQATDYYQQGLNICRETGDRYNEAWALNGLGEAAHIAGHPADAVTHHSTACTIAVDIGDRDQEARAHAGLGHAHHTLGNPALARHHYTHALTLYTDLGQPEADQIRTCLAALDADNPEQQ